jgi:hypothetical protein
MWRLGCARSNVNMSIYLSNKILYNFIKKLYSMILYRKILHLTHKLKTFVNYTKIYYLTKESESQNNKLSKKQYAKVSMCEKQCKLC